jgi:hypothetical protein
MSEVQPAEKRGSWISDDLENSLVQAIERPFL